MKSKIIKRISVCILVCLMAVGIFSNLSSDVGAAAGRGGSYIESAYGAVNYIRPLNFEDPLGSQLYQQYNRANAVVYVYPEETDLQIVRRPYMYFKTSDKDFLFMASEANLPNSTLDISAVADYVDVDLMSYDEIKAHPNASLLMVDSDWSHGIVKEDCAGFYLTAAQVQELLAIYGTDDIMFTQTLTYNTQYPMPAKDVVHSYIASGRTRNAGGSGGGQYMITTIDSDMKISGTVNKNNVVSGDIVRVNLELQNPSQHFLEGVTLDIYNSYDDTNKRLNGNISNVSISKADNVAIITDYQNTQTAHSELTKASALPIQSGEEAGSFIIGAWEGGNDYYNQSTDTNATIYISFDYIVDKADMINNNGKWELPIRAELNGTTPTHSFSYENSFANFYEDEERLGDYYHRGPALNYVKSLNEDALFILLSDIALTTVTYDPNGGQGNAYSISEEVAVNHIVLDNDGDSNLNFTLEDNILVSWNTKADGTGKTYKAGDSLMTVEGGTTLYAIWNPKGVEPTPEPEPKNPKDPEEKVKVTLTGNQGKKVNTSDTTDVMMLTTTMLALIGAVVAIKKKKYNND